MGARVNGKAGDVHAGQHLVVHCAGAPVAENEKRPGTGCPAGVRE
ncbi:hypothetical protein Ga0080559_TMP1119 [Salipiger profundus]|uniref:Uncharacterized protein n=1 Tax=Salipiger profundus TaxID=1229727 RepID=A0A1U7D1F8_9RHOB|nr:hypothetical protein Ga0080559_TMP1119 [Salipiger profundus]